MLSVCKGSAFFANMQALCVFAHAVEVSARENQWIRRQIVHGRKKTERGFRSVLVIILDPRD